MNREISKPESSFSLRAGRGARRRPFVTRSSRSGLAAGALLIGPDSVFGSRLEQLVALAIGTSSLLEEDGFEPSVPR